MVLFGALLVFTSCQKEDIIASDAQPTPLELRCCEDEMLSDPLFNDLFNDFQVGLIEPAETIISGANEDYIQSLLEDYDNCIAAGTDPYECLGIFDVLFDVKAYVDGLNAFLVDSLRDKYDDLSDEEFANSLGTALFNLVFDEDQRQLPCFGAYQTAIYASLINFAEDLATKHSSIAVGRLLRNYSIAKIAYCTCMYNTYGRAC